MTSARKAKVVTLMLGALALVGWTIWRISTDGSASSWALYLLAIGLGLYFFSSYYLTWLRGFNIYSKAQLTDKTVQQIRSLTFDAAFFTTREIQARSSQDLIDISEALTDGILISQYNYYRLLRAFNSPYTLFIEQVTEQKGKSSPIFKFSFFINKMRVGVGHFKIFEDDKMMPPMFVLSIDPKKFKNYILYAWAGSFAFFAAIFLANRFLDLGLEAPLIYLLGAFLALVAIVLTCKFIIPIIVAGNYKKSVRLTKHWYPRIEGGFLARLFSDRLSSSELKNVLREMDELAAQHSGLDIRYLAHGRTRVLLTGETELPHDIFQQLGG